MNSSYKVNNPLKKRLLSAFLISFLPALIILIISVEFLLIPSYENNVRNELNNATGIIRNSVRTSATVAIRNHLRTLAETNKAIVHHYYSLYEQGVLTRDEAFKRLRTILLEQKVGSSGYLYVIDSKGMVELHPNPGVEGVSLISFDFIKQQIANKDGYIEYDWQNPGEDSSRAKALYMIYYEPLDWIISVSSYRDEFNELINPDDFREAVLAMKFGETGYSYILDENGVTLIHPHLDNFNLFENPEASNDFLRKMLDTRSGVIEYLWKNPKDQKPYHKIAVYEEVPELKWLVVSSIYTDEIMYPVRVARYVSYGGILIVFFAGYLAAVIISRRFTKPIDNIMLQLDSNAQNGTYKHLELSTKDEIGRLAFEINQFLKVVEQQNTQIKVERAKYRNLFSTSPEGIFLLDHLTMIDCNPSTEKIFKANRNLLLGKTIIEFCPEFQPNGRRSEELANEYIGLSKENDFYKFEWKHFSFDGREFDAEVQLKPFNDNGKILYVAFMRDITERKQAEQKIVELNESLEQKVVERTSELNQALKVIEDSNIELKTLNDSIAQEASKLLILNEKLGISEKQLKEANLMKDKFISIIAHDLRNPIGGMRSLLEVVKLNLTKMTQQELASMIDTSYVASNRTYELLDNLLQWAKMQRDGIEFEPKLHIIQKLVDKCILQSKANAQYKSITIKQSIDTNLFAYFDEYYVHTILRNLLANAIKYSHEKSEIIISAANEDISDISDFVIISVIDHGVGIDQEDIDNMFRIDKVQTRAGTKGEKGTGLGLLLCKEFVEKHGGKIWVESKVGIGSTFKFSLPKKEIISKSNSHNYF